MQVRLQQDSNAFNRLKSDPTFWALCALIVLVCAFGGGSRHDIPELAWLRSGSAIILTYGFWRLSRDHWLSAWRPIAIFAGLALVMLVQLIPMPPSFWSNLPGRSLIAQLDQLAGIGEIWRPISLSPMATWNSLASLVVPFAALILFARLSSESIRTLPLIIALVACLSTALGIAQIATQGNEALYFYDVTNEGSAVGLFANRNHNGVMAAIGLLIVLWRGTAVQSERSLAYKAAWIALILFLIVGVMVNSSRAGFLSAVLALGLIAIARTANFGFLPGAFGSLRQRLGKIFLAISLGIGTMSLFIFADRSAAVERLLGRDPTEGLRWETAATTLSLAWDNLWFGVGFGAFDAAYRTVEPRALLRPQYLNEAHNDWLQFVIEGGALGLAVALASIVLLVGAYRKNRRLDEAASDEDRLLALMVLVVLAFASLVDYPLRTPLMMLVVAWVFFVLGRTPYTSNRKTK